MNQMVKVISKSKSTKALIEALPPVFTKAQYDALCYQNPLFYNAYTLMTLRRGGLIVIVNTEYFTAEVEYYNYRMMCLDTRFVEAQRHFYSLTEKGKTFFAELLDNNSNL